MSRRIQPPTHQTTGHPYVDNVLRDEWREYRDYLAKMGAYESPHLPRKLKKALVKQKLAAAFFYFELDHYSPKGVLL